MPRRTDPVSSRPVAPGANASLATWLSYLESIHPAEIDLGLDRVLTVLRRLFRNRPRVRVITVAGTNGKGSTVACLESLLRRAGRTTGAYTSPHLYRYNERVRINGTEATDEQLVTAFERVEAARGNVMLTYFEFGTLAAFQVFADAGVEDWILEVGLGGRLDAVNVMDPDLAVIASVDIDHVDFLGGDRETIGFEKAGILRQGRPAIYADIDPPRSVLQQVAAQRIPLKRLGVDYQITDTGEGMELTLMSPSRTLTLPATPLPRNSVAAAVVAALMLQPELDNLAITEALGEVRLAGRFECLASSPEIFVDVGHNPHAARWLADRIRARKPLLNKVYAVYACLADKDSSGVVDALADVVDDWFIGGLDCHRGLSAAELRARLAVSHPELVVREAPTVTAALSSAREKAQADDLIVIFGSFFTVAEARASVLGESS